MIDISRTNGKRDDRTAIKKKRGASQVSRTGHDFRTELESAIGYEPEGGLDDMMRDLKDQERRFMDSQSLFEMNRYKAMVQKILKSILEESIETRTVKRFRRDNRADFTVAQIINQKLLELTREVTGGNPAFRLMKTMEEIRGLILDLTH
jgi:uncharacterized protein YaaR (DUF327 family)